MRRSEGNQSVSKRADVPDSERRRSIVSDNTGDIRPAAEAGLPYDPMQQDQTVKRRVFISETVDYNNVRPGGERTREETEYVAVPRQVKYHEKVTKVPVRRQYEEYEPQWKVQTIKRQIPRENIEYEDTVTEVGHKQVIDEYVEAEYDAGTEIKCIPRVEVQERELEVTVPTIKWIEKEEHVPEIREIVRYVEADHNIERVIRYVPETPPGMPSISQMVAPGSPREDGSRSPSSVRSGTSGTSGTSGNHGNSGISGRGGAREQKSRSINLGKETLSPRFSSLDSPSNDRKITGEDGLNELEAPLQGMLLPREAINTIQYEKNAPVTIDIPVPYMAPKPTSLGIEVPLVRFRDAFVPVPGRRHVTSKLSFTDEIYDVPCVKEKPILIVQDYLKPVPVDTHIRVKEKDVQISPIDPAELTQCDMMAMWMRVNADLLDNFKSTHGDKYPRGMRDVPEEDKVPLKETDWEACLEREAAEEAAAATGGDEEGANETEDLGTIPLHPGHPLMMTFLQNQWMQNPTMTTHGMYTPEFFRHHYAAMNAQLDPKDHQVHLTEDQMLQLGPLAHEQLPSAWGSVAFLKNMEKDKHHPGQPIY